MTFNESGVRQAAAQALDLQFSAPVWRPLPHQIPPPGNWYGWLLMAGRGAGKSASCAKYIVDHVNGPPCIAGPIPHWIAIIAPTLGDAATSCFSGPSGIRSHDPEAKMTQRTGGVSIIWPNGSEAKLFGAHTPEDEERLRAGGNRCVTWCEELAAWRYLDSCFSHMRFGLRIGRRPHWIASTTPKPKPLLRKMINGEFKDIVVTHATTYDNPHLAQHIRDALEESYGGTTLGSQELLGKLVEQDENALWVRERINDGRVDEPPLLNKITVGVDPSGGAGEQGIVVVGKQVITATTDDLHKLNKTYDPSNSIVSIQKYLESKHIDNKSKKIQHGFVLADYSCKLSPAYWGRRAVQAAVDWETDDIVVETNFGGDMALATIQGAADAMGVPIPIRKVTASRGKRPRAEPVAALSERGRWHHVGVFEELEDQMSTWTPESDYSPDRLDAMVWPPWHMKLVSIMPRSSGKFGGRLMTSSIIK